MGRKRNLQRGDDPAALGFCYACFLASAGLIGIALAGSDGAWFPIPNLAGVGILVALCWAGREK